MFVLYALFVMQDLLRAYNAFNFINIVISLAALFVAILLVGLAICLHKRSGKKKQGEAA